MNIIDIKEAAQDLIDKIENLVNQQIPQKGDRAEDCQYIAIINSLNELESNFCGLESKDLIQDQDYEDINKRSGFINHKP